MRTEFRFWLLGTVEELSTFSTAWLFPFTYANCWEKAAELLSHQTSPLSETSATEKKIVP